MILKGDCIEVMKAMKPNSVDAVVCDPPYGLEFMGKEWDKLEPARNKQRWKGKERKLFSDYGIKDKNFKELPQFSTKRNPKCRECGHYKFSGTPCECESPDFDYRTNEHNLYQQLWHTQWLTEAYRVLKPGGSMLVMGGTRTSHRLACAIEDSGFIIKDTLMFLYGSGFPKAQDLGKMIDKRGGQSLRRFGQILKEARLKKGLTKTQLGEYFKTSSERINHGGCITNWEKGLNSPTAKQVNKLIDVLDLREDKAFEAEREKIAKGMSGKTAIWNEKGEMGDFDITNPSTNLAKHWDGFKVGGIKPAYEPILWAIKDLKIEPKYSIVEKISKSLGDILWHSLVESTSKDTPKLQEMVLIASNIVLLWNAILGEVLKNGNKFTTSMESKLITELRILNSLLSANMPKIMGGESQTYQNGIAKSQANGLKSVVKIVTEYLDDGKKNIKDIQNAIVQENAIYKQSKNGILAQSVEKDLQPIILSAFIVLKNVLIELSAEGNAKELKELVSIAEEFLKQSLQSQPSIAIESAWLKDIRRKVKPDFFPIIWSVKPPEGSYVDNVLKWNVGAVNVDECRIGCEAITAHHAPVGTFGGGEERKSSTDYYKIKGRFPANVILSHHPECVQVGMKKVKNQGGVPDRDTVKNSKPAFTSKKHTSNIHHFEKDGFETVESWDCHPDCAVRMLDEQSGVLNSGGGNKRNTEPNTFRAVIRHRNDNNIIGTNSGGASRFFYCAKASRAERNAGLDDIMMNGNRQMGTAKKGGKAGDLTCRGNTNPICQICSGSKIDRGNGICNCKEPKWEATNLSQSNNHPTVKPIKLFEYLIKLVTREGQIILDPFIGSGTTAIAAHNVGRKCVGIEKEDEYLEIAKRRIRHWENQPKQMEMGL